MSAKPKPQPETNEKGQRILTEKYISQLCEYNGGYLVPEYNFTAYIHFSGFSKIENLDSFNNLRVLYLDNNNIQKIEGLDKLIHLESLYLQNNYITKIENLNNNVKLSNLNLSSNKIKTIENLSSLHIDNLYLAKNKISSVDDLRDILNMPTVSVLDIQNNQIEGNQDEIIDLFSKAKSIKVLYFKGNDVIRKINQYRRTMIVKITSLMYLDDRPIKEEDRLGAIAYFEGGHPAEAKARKEYIEANDKVHEIRKKEQEEMKKVPFNERKENALKSLMNEYTKRKCEIEERKEKLIEEEVKDKQNLGDVDLKLYAYDYQLEENEKMKESEIKNITMTISKRQRCDQDVNFEYEEWMDKIIELCLVENFFNFDSALKCIINIFKEKKVRNCELFSDLDLRIRWCEIEMKKFNRGTDKHYFFLRREEVFDEEINIKQDVSECQPKPTKIESPKEEIKKNEQTNPEEPKGFSIQEGNIDENELNNGVTKKEIFEEGTQKNKPSMDELD